MVSEMSDRLRNRIVIPKPDYDSAQEPVHAPAPMPKPRPTQLNVRDSNSRQGISKVSTPIGGTMSPMTDSEQSSHSEVSMQCLHVHKTSEGTTVAVHVCM